ncbi:MAG: hypothetical protein NC928_06135 [Candidatus Omnitrophica bacterium]|nr:hypothetical protein [Candidatus Omnitrophota bacterium]
MKMKLYSTIKCPKCGFEKEEKMLRDSCLPFYICTNCKTILKPKEGECCVFCSYGTVKCPAKQKKYEK